jgi:N-acetyl-anhydromuramyl-L-alanine amidase AmpD
MADDINVQQQLNQLREQQSAITAGINAMNEGRWLASDYGAESLEAILMGLNPTWTNLAARAPLYQKPTPEPALNLVWIGSPNHYTGRAGQAVVAIVVHTMAGTLTACDNWFRNPAAQVSSHFGIGLAGQQHQYVRLQDGSWANGILESGNQWTRIVGNSVNPNYQTVTIETEDNGSGSTPVSDAQYASTLAVARLALQTFPGIRYLMGHDIISPNSRNQCCGNRWWASGRFDQLARDLGLEGHH